MWIYHLSLPLFLSLSFFLSDVWIYVFSFFLMCGYMFFSFFLSDVWIHVFWKTEQSILFIAFGLGTLVKEFFQREKRKE